MYELTVKSHFDAAHALRGYPGECRKLHGHTWDVEVTVAGETLDDVGIVYDFKSLKDDLNAVLDEYDHAYLNDVPPFDDSHADGREPGAGDLREPRGDGRPARERRRSRRVGVTDREAGLPPVGRAREAGRRLDVRLRIELSRETSPAGCSYRTGFPFLTFAGLRLRRATSRFVAFLGTLSGSYWYAVFRSSLRSTSRDKTDSTHMPEGVSTRFWRIVGLRDRRSFSGDRRMSRRDKRKHWHFLLQRPWQDVCAGQSLTPRISLYEERFRALQEGRITCPPRRSKSTSSPSTGCPRRGRRSGRPRSPSRSGSPVPR